MVRSFILSLCVWAAICVEMKVWVGWWLYILMWIVCMVHTSKWKSLERNAFGGAFFFLFSLFKKCTAIAHGSIFNSFFVVNAMTTMTTTTMVFIVKKVVSYSERNREWTRESILFYTFHIIVISTIKLNILYCHCDVLWCVLLCVCMFFFLFFFSFLILCLAYVYWAHHSPLYRYKFVWRIVCNLHYIQ